MNFSTKIPIPQAQFPIDYNSKIISLGSCFAENISEKLDYFKFQNTVNPFGIIFNPVSIEKMIFRAVNQVFFKEEDVFFYNERWHSFEVHSEWSGGSKAELLENLNAILQDFHNQILQATHIIITYGSSWVYRNIENNAIVANCHKVPQKQFSKEILSVETIQKAIENSLDLIQKRNPNCHFIFTVSPVRHIKDGFVENQRSKSHLIAAIQNVLQSKNEPKINYFPSYEIMMDELRDYRFYGQDMLHPSPVAIDYIWEQFFLTQITPANYPIMNDVCAVKKGFLHKPFHPDSQNHQQFLAKLQAKIATIQHEFPHIRF